MSQVVRFQNLFLMLVSLALAVVLWLHVQSTLNPPKPGTPWPVDVVTDLGANKKSLEVASCTPPRVKLTYIGSDPSKLGSGTFKAYVDLSKAAAGTGSYRVRVDPPTGVSLDDLKISPPTVTVVIERHETAPKAVSVATTGLPKGDYVYRDSSINPTSVEVSGPASLVDTVAKVQAILDLGTVQLGSEQVVNVEALDEDGIPVKRVKCRPTAVAIRAALSPAPTTKRLFVTANCTGQAAVGYQVVDLEMRPSYVDATGKSEVLSRMRAVIETAPFSVDGFKEDTAVKVGLRVPAGVTLSVPASVRVLVKVVKRSDADAVPKGGG